MESSLTNGQLNLPPDRGIKTNPFGPNSLGERAYRRAERLVAALHIITNHIEKDEPVRCRIRNVSMSVLRGILNLKDDLRAPGSPRLGNVLALIRELISLTHLLAVAGLVSDQNARILSEASDELGNFLTTSKHSTLSESVRFTREEIITDIASDKQMSVTERGSKGTYYMDSKKTQGGSGPVLQVDKSIRARKILSILASHGQMSIKDIAVNLPEYSEKMIQRELAALIAAERVQKHGSKRWSRYALTSNSGSSSASL